MKKLFALFLALILLCGCSTQSQEPTSSTTASEPLGETTPGESVKPARFGMSYLPESGLNPYTCDATINRATFSLLYESLFVVSNQFRSEPLLCDSFTVSEDGKTYRFTLLSDVRFSDGTALTGADVAASLRAAADSDFYAGRLEHMSSVSAEGNVVTVRLNTAYENFSLMLDVPILKESTIDSQTPIGTGAYAVQGAQLVRNRYWWQTQAPAVNLETISLSTAATQSELRDDFEFGGTDIIYCDPNSPAAIHYRCDYEVWEVPTTVLHYIGFNLSKGIFTNATLRTAVTYAVDREGLVASVYGGFAVPTVFPCSPNSDLYDTQLASSYVYDAPHFRSAVHNSGVVTSEATAGVFLVCSDDPVRVKAAEQIAEEMKSCGLYLTVKALSWKEYRTALRQGAYDLYFGEVRLTVNFDLSEFFASNGNLNYGSIADASLSTLCLAALENSGSYAELCKQLLDNAPICPVVFKSYAIYVTRGAISSVTPALDCVFHNSATARTLADADKTYAETESTSESSEPTEPSAPAEPSTAVEPPAER